MHATQFLHRFLYVYCSVCSISHNKTASPSTPLSVLLSVHVCIIYLCLHCNNYDLEKNGMEFCRRGRIWQQVMDRWRQRVAGQKYMVKPCTAFHLTVPKPSWHFNMFKHIWRKTRLVSVSQQSDHTGTLMTQLEEWESSFERQSSPVTFKSLDGRHVEW